MRKLTSTERSNLICGKRFGDIIQTTIDDQLLTGVYLENLTDLEPGWSEDVLASIQRCGDYGRYKSIDGNLNGLYFGLRTVFHAEFGFVSQLLTESFNTLAWINYDKSRTLLTPNKHTGIIKANPLFDALVGKAFEALSNQRKHFSELDFVSLKQSETLEEIAALESKEESVLMAWALSTRHYNPNMLNDVLSGSMRYYPALNDYLERVLKIAA